ncbi:MAG TPA: stage 0 sporulation family protein [Geobacteraceae bacterium]|nr:stage 0 sporulation family protein [Geobacteraceae bacterium]
MITIVKVQFHTAEKLYDFNSAGLELSPGDRVIVETDRGRSMAIVATAPAQIPEELAPESIKSILRKANQADIEAAERNTAREKETFEFCQAKIAERNLEMKLVKVEYVYDGSKAVFYFTADGRIDFRDLVKDLAHQFHTRIEMRQIGVRDEAKLVGGIGICGRELCCSSFLRDFAPVSVKMAKEQNLALNPTKISGQCGRLLCCLGYEFDTYCELRKGLPKCGKHVKCGKAEGEVIKVSTLGRNFTVRTTDSREVLLTPEDLKDEGQTETTTATQTAEQAAPSAEPQPRPQQKQGTPRLQRQPKQRPPKQGQQTQPQQQQQTSQQSPKPRPDEQPKEEKEKQGGAGRRRNRNRHRQGGKGKPDKPKETP